MGMYEEAYKTLNAAQKQAVDTIDGPVLVVAGPGTGKTQLLSMRVANILRQTDTDPGSILCLTFTNKAALNMRERLLQLTGGEAKGVMIKTFHSFAAELMNIYPDYFWNGARLTTAPDTIQLEIIQDILGKLPLDNPLALKFAGNFTAGKDVKNGLRLAKEAGLTPDKLKALVKANLAYIDIIEPKLVDALSAPLSFKKLPDLQIAISKLPEQGISIELQPLEDLGRVIKNSLDFAVKQDGETGKTTNTGKWKKKFIQTVDGEKGMFKERERNQWWLSLAGVYETYRNQLHSRGYYDYSDMIVEVISQLQTQPSLRADTQERFLYVLIDEFQDTNAAQLQLAHLVADHHTANGKPNLMAVGDDDQSIYKFNGAELNNMMSFRTSYPATKLIVLTDNYRSSQAVLDTSAKIISTAADRLVVRDKTITKNLTARNTPASPGTIELRQYATQEYELSGIADDIAKLHNSGNNSVAVLARNHASLRRLSSLLLARDVPINYEAQSNILDNPALVQIQTLLRLILAIRIGDTEQTNYLLSQSLRHPMWGFDPKALWHLATANNRRGNWLQNLLDAKDEQQNNIGEWLIWLSNESANQPLVITTEYVLGLRAGEHLTSPVREYFMKRGLVDSDYIQTLSAVRLLQATVSEFSRTGSAQLEEFVAFLELAERTEEIIADETAYVSGSNAVQLMTVHKAKGLEFDTVYVIDAIDNNWKPSPGGRKPPANLPLQPALEDADDYARLLYVAATRAKRSLIVASYAEDSNGRELLTTPLLLGALEPRQIKTLPDKAAATLEEHIAWPHLNITDERAVLRDILANFSLSASSLQAFLDVSQGGPDYFFERHLLNLPEPRTANLSFGTAVHDALEYAQILVNSDSPDTKKVLARFNESLKNQQLPDHEEQRFLDHGKLLLTKLLASDTFWLPKGSLPEQNINDVFIGEAKLKGKLDRIDLNKEGLTIVDYKTGKPLSSFTTRDQNLAIKAWRHRTQLTFYALLVRESARFKSTNIKGQMIYVEAASPKELIREFNPSEQDVDDMTTLIQTIWPKIKSLNLPKVTNYSADYSGIQTFTQDLIEGKI